MAKSLETIIESVDALSDAKTFSVLDAIQARTYPTDDVTLYLDFQGAFELNDLTKRARNASSKAEVEALDKQIEELREAIGETALTFHMRGFNAEVAEAIEQKIRSAHGMRASDEWLPAHEDALVEFNNSCIAQTIVYVARADGAQDRGPFDASFIQALEKKLGFEQTNKLLQKTQELSFAAAYFENVVSADF